TAAVTVIVPLGALLITAAPFMKMPLPPPLQVAVAVLINAQLVKDLLTSPPLIVSPPKALMVVLLPWMVPTPLQVIGPLTLTLLLAPSVPLMFNAPGAIVPPGIRLAVLPADKLTVFPLIV